MYNSSSVFCFDFHFHFRATVVSTFLDPRFKSHYFSGNVVTGKAIDWLIEAQKELDQGTIIEVQGIQGPFDS